MKKYVLTVMLLLLCIITASASSKVVYTTNITRDVEKTMSEPTLFRVSTNVLCDIFGYSSQSALVSDISSGDIQLVSFNSSGKEVSYTYSKGYWFTANGVPCKASNTNRRVGCKYEDGFFSIVHYNIKASEGDVYNFIEYFIHDTDTVQYVFSVVMGTPENITTDQPAYEAKIEHRADHTDSWVVQPSVRLNEQTPLTQNYIQVWAGDKITLSCVLPDDAVDGRFSWKYRGTKSLQTLKKNPELIIEQADSADAGYYVLSGYYNNTDNERISFKECYFYVDVQEEPLGTPFSWEGRVPKFSHDWSTDADYNYGVYEQPTKMHSIKKKNGKPANSYEGEWWSAFWGDNLNSEVGTDSATVYGAAKNMVEKYDRDFAYIRDYMGWPPDLSARNGYKSFVYVFGSGLANDNTSNTEKGGYQSATSVDGGYYACVWASYYPFSRFRSDADSKWTDGDYQREAMIHEGIHAIFADLDACSKSSWFHEAGNVWLQSAMNTERDGVYGDPGYLDSCPFVAPFMPIECYSGWLQDGSFGGPQAEGVNMYNSSGQQICTWRNLLGGTQYGNSFPIILGEICGKGSIPWIWRNCKDWVLKSIGSYLGEATMRTLIQEYRSRQAIFDMGGWKKGYRNITNAYMGTTVKAEWSPYWIDVAPFKLTPYQGLTLNSTDGWMAPDTLTNPGWSGSNIIPIHVDSKANTVTVEFRPEDTEMRAQLCYVTKDGTNYYSQPVHCGKMQIDVTDRPANNVIFCVVCNTDYIFKNDEIQRKKHWDYRIRFGEGALQVADLYIKWNMNESTLTDSNYDEDKAREEATSIQTPVVRDSYVQGDNGVRLISGLAKAGHPIRVNLEGVNAEDVHVNIIGLSGIVADEAPLNSDNTYTLPANLRSGLYIIKFTHGVKTDTYKVIIK